MTLGAFVRDRFLQPIRRAQGTPESIARGGALGMWVALTPTVGAQSLMVGVLAVPMRANLPVALVMCWITNPITLIPFYFAYYWLGTAILGMPTEGYASIGQRIQEQFAQVAEVGLWDSMQPLGREILWPMTVGSIVMATIVAIPTYHLLARLFRRQLERQLVQRRDSAKFPGALPSKSEIPVGSPDP